MNTVQEGNIDNQDSNGFSSTSFIPQFVHRLSLKKPTAGPAVSIQQKFKNFSFQLFNVLEIITPTRLKPFQLRKQLQNYQYEKVQRKYDSQHLQKFGKVEQQLMKQQQNLVLMLTSVMKQFKSSMDKYFYILTKKTKRVFHFYHNKDNKGNYTQTTLTICNLGQKISPELDKTNIPYQNISTQQYQKLIIKNQAISIFWGLIINKILQNEKYFKSFYLLTNFSFAGGMEILPVQLFNGIENQKQYSYIAKPSTNIIGEQLSQVYRMKISGLWTFQNVLKVCEAMRNQFGDNFFDIQFQVEKASQYLKLDQQIK